MRPRSPSSSLVFQQLSAGARVVIVAHPPLILLYARIEKYYADVADELQPRQGHPATRRDVPAWSWFPSHHQPTHRTMRRAKAPALGWIRVVAEASSRHRRAGIGRRAGVEGDGIRGPARDHHQPSAAPRPLGVSVRQLRRLTAAKIAVLTRGPGPTSTVTTSSTTSAASCSPPLRPSTTVTVVDTLPHRLLIRSAKKVGGFPLCADGWLRGSPAMFHTRKTQRGRWYSSLGAKTEERENLGPKGGDRGGAGSEPFRRISEGQRARTAGITATPEPIGHGGDRHPHQVPTMILPGLSVPSTVT